MTPAPHHYYETELNTQGGRVTSAQQRATPTARSRSVRESLETTTCPKCGAEPGQHCSTDNPPRGKNPMHVQRMTTPLQKENA